MKEDSQKFELQTKSGESVTVGDVSVTPRSQALTIRWPQGGWVWNRPHSLIVQRGEETEHIPVLDITRILQVGLYALSALFVILSFVFMIRKVSSQK